MDPNKEQHLRYFAAKLQNSYPQMVEGLLDSLNLRLCQLISEVTNQRTDPQTPVQPNVLLSLNLSSIASLLSNQPQIGSPSPNQQLNPHQQPLPNQANLPHTEPPIQPPVASPGLISGQLTYQRLIDLCSANQLIDKFHLKNLFPELFKEYQRQLTQANQSVAEEDDLVDNMPLAPVNIANWLADVQKIIKSSSDHQLDQNILTYRNLPLFIDHLIQRAASQPNEVNQMDYAFISPQLVRYNNRWKSSNVFLDPKVIFHVRPSELLHLKRFKLYSPVSNDQIELLSELTKSTSLVELLIETLKLSSYNLEFDSLQILSIDSVQKRNQAIDFEPKGDKKLPQFAVPKLCALFLGE